MFFFLKRKKIVVDAYTSLPLLSEMAPIQPTRKFLPEWWKNLPKYYNARRPDQEIFTKRGTLKSCDGFLDYNKTGFIIPMWSDLKIATSKNGRWTYAFPGNDPYPIVDHPPEQYGHNFSNYINLKIVSPWMFEEKTGVNFYWNAATWYHPHLWGKINILPGTLNYKFHRSTNIPMFVPKIDAEIEIMHGDPLIHVVPLSENEVQVKMHQISYDEFLQRSNGYNFNRKFLGSYKAHKRVVLENEKKGKCPFGFGK